MLDTVKFKDNLMKYKTIESFGELDIYDAALVVLEGSVFNGMIGTVVCIETSETCNVATLKFNEPVPPGCKRAIFSDPKSLIKLIPSKDDIEEHIVQSLTEIYNFRVERTDFRKELETLINRYNKESGSNTPDFVLSDYLCQCLDAYDLAVNRRDKLKLG